MKVSEVVSTECELESENLNFLGRRIHRRRLDLTMNLTQLATQLRVTKRVLNSIEQGHSRPSDELTHDIGFLLKLDVKELQALRLPEGHVSYEG